MHLPPFIAWLMTYQNCIIKNCKTGKACVCLFIQPYLEKPVLQSKNLPIFLDFVLQR